MRLSTPGLSVVIDPDTHGLTFDYPGAGALRTPAPPRCQLAAVDAGGAYLTFVGLGAGPLADIASTDRE